MNNHIHKRCYSVNEVKEMYGLGRTTIYEEIKSGNLKTVKIGKRRLIPVVALEDWERTLRELSEVTQ